MLEQELCDTDYCYYDSDFIWMPTRGGGGGGILDRAETIGCTRSPLCCQTDGAANKFRLVWLEVAPQLQISAYVALTPQGGDVSEMFCLKNKRLRPPHLDVCDSLAHVTTIFHCFLSSTPAQPCCCRSYLRASVKTRLSSTADRRVKHVWLYFLQTEHCPHFIIWRESLPWSPTTLGFCRRYLLVARSSYPHTFV